MKIANNIVLGDAAEEKLAFLFYYLSFQDLFHILFLSGKLQPLPL